MSKHNKREIDHFEEMEKHLRIYLKHTLKMWLILFKRGPCNVQEGDEKKKNGTKWYFLVTTLKKHQVYMVLALDNVGTENKVSEKKRKHIFIDNLPSLLLVHYEYVQICFGIISECQFSFGCFVIIFSLILSRSSLLSNRNDFLIQKYHLKSFYYIKASERWRRAND